jgi:hypothetical protein
MFGTVRHKDGRIDCGRAMEETEAFREIKKLARLLEEEFGEGLGIGFNADENNAYFDFTIDARHPDINETTRATIIKIKDILGHDKVNQSSRGGWRPSFETITLEMNLKDAFILRDKVTELSTKNEPSLELR